MTPRMRGLRSAGAECAELVRESRRAPRTCRAPQRAMRDQLDGSTCASSFQYAATTPHSAYARTPWSSPCVVRSLARHSVARVGYRRSREHGGRPRDRCGLDRGSTERGRARARARARARCRVDVCRGRAELCGVHRAPRAVRASIGTSDPPRALRTVTRSTMRHVGSRCSAGCESRSTCRSRSPRLVRGVRPTMQCRRRLRATGSGRIARTNRARGRSQRRCAPGFEAHGYALACTATPSAPSARCSRCSRTRRCSRCSRSTIASRTSSRARRSTARAHARRATARVACEVARDPPRARDRIDGIAFRIPSGGTAAGLKRFEDALDALICAWVGIDYLAGRARPYGDTSAAVWTSVGRTPQSW